MDYKSLFIDCIIKNKCFEIRYVNSKKENKLYWPIDNISNTWINAIRVNYLWKSKEFRLDRILDLKVLEYSWSFKQEIINQAKENKLFQEEFKRNNPRLPEGFQKKVIYNPSDINVNLPSIDGYILCYITEIHDWDWGYFVKVDDSSKKQHMFRIIGIDAFELDSVNSIEKEYAIKARNYLSNLINKHATYFKEYWYDCYGRMLVTIKNYNWLTIALEMIKEGYAIPLCSEDFTNKKEYIDLFCQSYKEKKGYFRHIKDDKYNNIINNNKSGIKFNNSWFNTKKSALKRFDNSFVIEIVGISRNIDKASTHILDNISIWNHIELRNDSSSRYDEYAIQCKYNDIIIWHLPNPNSERESSRKKITLDERNTILYWIQNNRCLATVFLKKKQKESYIIKLCIKEKEQ